MNHLLIMSILAVLPMIEGQMITNLEACTSKTNQLLVNCTYIRPGSGTINYEWRLLKKQSSEMLIASSIEPSKVAPTFKNRANVTKTNTQVQLTLTGFGTADEGNYECRLSSVTNPNQDYNKTIPVVKAKVQTCGAPGLLLNTPWMLSLLLSLTVLQALDALPCRSEN